MQSGIEVLSKRSIRVEAASLEVPREQYDADYAWLAERNGAVSIFFAKGDAGRDGLVSRVEVRFAYEVFVQHFSESAREFHEEIRKEFVGSALMARAGREQRKPHEASAIKQHSLWASLDVIARNGTAATLDFYHLSPAALVHFGRTGDQSKLAVTPVLRINTTIFEVLRLLDSVEPLAKELAPLLSSPETVKD